MPRSPTINGRSASSRRRCSTCGERLATPRPRDIVAPGGSITRGRGSHGTGEGGPHSWHSAWTSRRQELDNEQPSWMDGGGVGGRVPRGRPRGDRANDDADDAEADRHGGE